MKNKNKTIVEPKNGSITKKIGRYAVIVVLYIAIVTTLAFIMSTISLIVNADSTGGGVTWSNPYTYSSMTIYTDNGAYCVGSNDYFTASGSSQSGVGFDDYYSIIADEDEEELYFYLQSETLFYSFLLPSENITFRDLFLNYGTIVNYSSNQYYTYQSFDSIGLLNIDKYDLDINSNVNVHIGTYNGSYYMMPGYSFGAYLNDVIIPGKTYTFIAGSGGGGNDDDPGTEQPGTENEFWRPTDEPGSYSLNNRAVADSPISIKRLNTATYNPNGYYSIFSEITSPNIIGFDFSFTKDIAVTYSQLTNNEFYYNYSMTNDFSITKVYKLSYYDIDGNLQTQDITSIISYDANDTGTLLPTLDEIEFYIGENNIGSQDIYLISSLYVSTNSSIAVDTDYVHIFEWIAFNITDTRMITNNLVNNFYRSTKFDMGEILLNSVNSFLKFELIPGFSLLSLLALVIGIPLLIYILKLFLGG